MLPQFTLYARIIFFMMVMFAFATTACSKKTNDYVIMLKNHERALHINAAGKVTATDISLAQFFTMESVTDALSDTFRIALYVKEVGRYLCFRKGKLVGMKHLVPDCHFIEKMDHGYFLYANAYKPEWRVGFTRGLKPVGPRHLQRPQTMRRACFLFVKINAEHFDRDMFTTTTTTTTTTTMSPLKKLIESRDQHSIRDYGLEEYERRLNSSRGRNYRTHSRTEPERRRGSTGGGGGVGHRHRSPETRHRNVSNTPQPKNLRRPQPTQKAGEERRKKTQRENVRRVHTNGQRKRKQVDSHYDHSDLPPNSQSSRAGGGTSSSSSASSTASVTATSLAATVSLAPSALNLVAMLAASRRKRVKRKKLEEEQQEESETQASGGNAEKQRSANSDLQLVAHDDGHESEQLYDLPAKKARKSQTPHDHSYHQKSSYAEHLHAEQMPVATTPEHFVQQPQNHKYSNSNAKKFHSHKRSNNSHHSRNSHTQQQQGEKERDEEGEEEAANPSHSLSSSGNNNKNNYLNENLSKLTKLKTNTNINLNLNTNINNNTNNLNANAILPALPKNFNNTDKQNSHNNQAKQYLNLMTDFKQLQTPTPALNVSQQPQHQQHHRRQHHNNNGVKNSLRRHRHKRDLGFSLPQLSATSQMTRPQRRSNADELRGLVNKENELLAFHRRSSDLESLDNSKRVEYEGEHDNDVDDDAAENGGNTINKSNRLLDNNNNNHKHLSEDNNFLQQQQQQRPQPSGLPFNRLKYPNNVNRISSDDDDDDDDDDVDVSSMKLQKQNIPNEHNITSHSLESDANYNPMKIRYNKANYLTAAATTTTTNNNINITNNVNKPNASFSGVFSQLNVINNNNYMRHQSHSRSSSSSSSGSSVSAVKKTNVNNNITRHNVIIISNVLNNDDIDVSGSGAAATATATAFQTRFVLGQKNMYRQLQQQKTQQQQVIDNKFITNTNLNNNNNINVHYIYNHNEKKTKQNDVNDDEDDDDVYENFIKTENKYEKIIVQ